MGKKVRNKRTYAKENSRKQKRSKGNIKSKFRRKEGYLGFLKFMAEHRSLTIAVLVIIGIAFFPVLGNEFLNFDDKKFIYDNLLIIGFPSLHDFFSEQLFTPHYKPLVYLSWRLEYLLFGIDPVFFHLNNLILHLINSLLVFYIFHRILRLYFGDKQLVYLSAFAALLFAVHPMKVESVAWAVERKDVLFSFFYLLAIVSYIKFISKEKGVGWLWLSALFYLLSILSKAPGVTLLAAYFLLDFVSKRKFNTNLLLEKIPALIVFLIALTLYGYIFQSDPQLSRLVGGVVGSSDSIQYPVNLQEMPSLYRRFLIINYRFWAFTIHLIAPVKLSIIYPRYTLLSEIGQFIHMIPLLTLGLIYLTWKMIANYRIIAFGLLLYFITLSPALAFAETGTNFLSDRYTYIPSIGLILAVVSALYYLFDHKLFGMTGMAVAVTGVFLFLVVTFGRVKDWKTTVTIFSDTIEKYPESFMAYNNRALIYRRTGALDLALQDYSKAIELVPSYHEAYINRGNIYFDQRKDNLALSDYAKAIEIAPNDARSYSSRGALLATQGKYQAALTDFNKALNLRPAFKDALSNRIKLFDVIGRKQDALNDINKYYEIFGRDPEIVQIENEILRK